MIHKRAKGPRVVMLGLKEAKHDDAQRVDRDVCGGVGGQRG